MRSFTQILNQYLKQGKLIAAVNSRKGSKNVSEYQMNIKNLIIVTLQVSKYVLKHSKGLISLASLIFKISKKTFPRRWSFSFTLHVKRNKTKHKQIVHENTLATRGSHARNSNRRSLWEIYFLTLISS